MSLIDSARGVERFDHVVMACHSDQSLRLLDDADGDERTLLAAVPYQPNTAWLHTDARLMPRRRAAWAAWNYLSNGDPDAPEVSVTYWLNRLQPLPFRSPVFVSLNPLTPPDPRRTIARLSTTIIRSSTATRWRHSGACQRCRVGAARGTRAPGPVTGFTRTDCAPASRSRRR